MEKKRIDYIDSLRGLSMILVVLAHFYLCMNPRHWDGSPLASILMSFRMPLFFFVSGFFAYRPIEKWTLSLTKDIMSRKVKAQLLCALVFFMLYQYVTHGPILYFIGHGFGYFWFTISLFQMFCVYAALSVVSHFIKRDLATCGTILLALCSTVFGNFEYNSPAGILLSWHNTIYYFQFFAVGILSRRFEHIFSQFIDNNIVRAIIILTFFGGCFYYYGFWYSAPHDLPTYIGQGVIHRMSGLLTVLIFFRHREAYFAGDALPARFLKFTGQRTLDVYMMHMFFMPHVPQWSAVLNAPTMSVPKLIVGLGISIAIVGICLLISSVLRSSHFLSVWLFGVKPYKRVKK